MQTLFRGITVNCFAFTVQFITAQLHFECLRFTLKGCDTDPVCFQLTSMFRGAKLHVDERSSPNVPIYH